MTDLPNNEAYLIAGLGNPGRDHRENRHNIGFMAIDELSRALAIPVNRVQSRALVGAGHALGRRVILAKPQTYMNLSGQAIGGLVHFYKLPLANFLVIHDDLDIPLGTIRLRPKGSSAGQKGIGSTIHTLGTQDFPRMRLGIGRPPGRVDPSAYVLEDFSPAEKKLLAPLMEKIVLAVKTYIERGLDVAMNGYNGLFFEEK